MESVTDDVVHDALEVILILLVLYLMVEMEFTRGRFGLLSLVA